MADEFVITRRVQFAETDMARVMHFAAYYRFMEEVEHAFWRSGDLSVVTDVDGQEVGWPRVATSCEYYEPARFEDEIELALKVLDVGEQSVTYEVEFRSVGRRIAVGRMTAVCCTGGGGGGFQAITIPDRLRQRLETHRGSG